MTSFTKNSAIFSLAAILAGVTTNAGAEPKQDCFNIAARALEPKAEYLAHNGQKTAFSIPAKTQTVYGENVLRITVRAPKESAVMIVDAGKEQINLYGTAIQTLKPDNIKESYLVINSKSLNFSAQNIVLPSATMTYQGLDAAGPHAELFTALKNCLKPN